MDADHKFARDIIVGDTIWNPMGKAWFTVTAVSTDGDPTIPRGVVVTVLGQYSDGVRLTLRWVDNAGVSVKP